jgi:glycosyltransferase involved in cell wall biosynthesis
VKFLFISSRYAGGIGGHASLLAGKLIENGHEVDKMTAPHIPIKNLKNPSFTILSTLKGLFSTKNYDIVHAFNVPSAFAMRFAKGKKKVLSIHGIFSQNIKAIHSEKISFIGTLAESKALKWADKLTTDSKYTQKEYKEKVDIDFEYLPSPIEPSKFKDVIKKPKVENQVVYLGRDSYEKGIDVLKSAEPKINGKVIYCTNLSWLEAMSTLQTSSVLVLPSRIESLPAAIKEAFFLKVPVVATNVGGVPELVTNNENGLLVPPNDPQKLADSINTILENKELGKKLANKGYEFVINNMTWDVIFPQYLKFYQSLIA